jgi:hypothetical protein
VRPDIASEEYGCHPAGADASLDLASACERGVDKLFSGMQEILASRS